MLNDTTHAVKYSKPERFNDRYNYITNELVNILYSSPKSFVYILKMTFSNAFSLTKDDAHFIIEGITSRVGSSDLSHCLSNVDDTAVVRLKSRPAISEDVLAHLGDDGFQLAVLLARHSYGDMNETAAELRNHSEAAIKSGSGVYITCFKLGSVRVRVSTSLPSYESAIDIM